MPTTAGTFKRVRLYGRTREDVRRKLTKLLEQADQGIPVAAENWTVGNTSRTGWSMWSYPSGGPAPTTGTRA